MRDLCESARRGKPCCDDLCHSGNETLCGFDPYFYEMIKREYGGEDVPEGLEHEEDEDSH